MKEILQDLSKQELISLVSGLGERVFRAEQIFSGLSQGKKISALPIPKALREALLARFEDEPLKIERVLSSEDKKTDKFLFSLSDGNLIEGVFMRHDYGSSQCVSTQVGCRMGCKFCASTLGGLKRNLTKGEMFAQVALVNRYEGGSIRERAVRNLVLMGSGEPFDNYDEVVSFLRGITAAGGLNIGARNISLSTCGLVPQMYKFAGEGIPLTLAVSLHAVTDEERRRTMPIAAKYPISEILDACSAYFAATKRRYIFEYTLITGENSDEAHARALGSLLKGRPCHVNLIRLNAVEERTLKAATDREAEVFLKILEKQGISATFRRSMGSDVGGACGQLRASHLSKEEHK